MSYYKQLSLRNQWMRERAAEANSMFSSKTASPKEKEDFIRRNPWYLEAGIEGNWSEDLKETDLMALVVLDDMPHETINEALRLSTEEEGEPYLWLADTYDTIPDYNPESPGSQGTLGPIGSDWRSPFIGSSVEEVAAFIQVAPKPPKPLCKRFFAVLRKEQFVQSKQLLIYKIVDIEDDSGGGIELQSVPCPVYLTGYFFMSYDRYPSIWEQAVREQGLYFGAGAHWPDDCGEGFDLVALLVLDEFPMEALNKILQDNGAEDSGLWLADTYEGLPDIRPGHRLQATSCPIDNGWQSPFIGKSIEDAGNFVRNAPKPPKPLNKTFFAVLQRALFEMSGDVLVCKILPVGGETDLSEDEQLNTESFRREGMSLMCKIQSDKPPKVEGSSMAGETEGEFEVQMT